MTDEIKQAMARAFFASAYADAHEACEAAGGDPGFSSVGIEWFDVLPDDIDPAALKAAEGLERELLASNLTLGSLESLFDIAVSAQNEEDSGDRDLTPDNFGHYLAMQAMGHGVGLADAFGRAVRESIKVPYLDFGGYSLERDYFHAPSKTFRVWHLDVWGNTVDGWTVNDRRDSGLTVEIPNSICDDEETIEHLRTAGIIKHAEPIWEADWEGDETCIIRRKDDGKPAIMLEWEG